MKYYWGLIKRNICLDLICFIEIALAICLLAGTINLNLNSKKVISSVNKAYFEICSASFKMEGNAELESSEVDEKLRIIEEKYVKKLECGFVNSTTIGENENKLNITFLNNEVCEKVNLNITKGVGFNSQANGEYKEAIVNEKLEKQFVLNETYTLGEENVIIVGYYKGFGINEDTIKNISSISYTYTDIMIRDNNLISSSFFAFNIDTPILYEVTDKCLLSIDLPSFDTIFYFDINTAQDLQFLCGLIAFLCMICIFTFSYIKLLKLNNLNAMFFMFGLTRKKLVVIEVLRELTTFIIASALGIILIVVNAASWVSLIYAICIIGAIYFACNLIRLITTIKTNYLNVISEENK